MNLYFFFVKVKVFNIPWGTQTCSIVPQQDLNLYLLKCSRIELATYKFFPVRVDLFLERLNHIRKHTKNEGKKHGGVSKHLNP